MHIKYASVFLLAAIVRADQAKTAAAAETVDRVGMHIVRDGDIHLNSDLPVFDCTAHMSTDGTTYWSSKKEEESDC